MSFLIMLALWLAVGYLMFRWWDVNETSLNLTLPVLIVMLMIAMPWIAMAFCYTVASAMWSSFRGRHD